MSAPPEYSPPSAGTLRDSLFCRLKMHPLDASASGWVSSLAWSTVIEAQCYHHKGRGALDPATTPRTNRAPSPDHYPILESAGGHFVPENVRLSHVWCNNRDYGWRMQIRTLLANGKSLAEIAETPNSKGLPPAHGRNRWTAAMVRKAYVS